MSSSSALDRLARRLGYQRITPATPPAAKRRKYGPTPGYHRLDKLPHINTVIDIGIGDQGSRFLYERFPSAFYFCIDPLAECRAPLAANLREEQYAFFILAVGAAPGEVSISVSAKPSRTSLYARTTQDDMSYPVETRTVAVATLDKLFQERRIERPALLKIDAEGSELAILSGARQTLQSIDYIVIEMPLTENFVRGCAFSDIIAILTDADFAPFQILKAGNCTTDVLFSRRNDGIRQRWAYGSPLLKE